MTDIYSDIETLNTQKKDLLARLMAEEKALNENLTKVHSAITELTGGVVSICDRGRNLERSKLGKKKTKRIMSPEAKAKIAAAQKKRWAAFHAKKKK